MELIERLLLGLADALHSTRQLNYQGRLYDLGRPFRRVTIEEMILEHNPGFDAAQIRIRSTCARIASNLGSRSMPRTGRASCRRRS